MSRLSRISLLPLAALAVAAIAPAARAGTIDLSAYGWMATTDDNVDITVLNAGQGGVVLSLQKFADFTTPPDANGVVQPLNIVFRQVSRNAVSQIAFEEENVFNDTGVSWTGFRFSLMSEAGANEVTFDTAKSGNFSTAPFGTKTYSEGDTVLTVTGGTLESGNFPSNQWTPGRASGGLFINANPFTSGSGEQSFVFSEQPIVGGNNPPPPPPTVIPLPASAYSTLGGLGALVAWSMFKKRK